MRIPAVILWAYLRRGAIIWLTMRLCVSVVLLFGGGNPLDLAPSTILVLILMSAGLMLADIRRRDERLLIGNLGFRPSALSCLALVPAVIGEAGLRVFTAGMP